MAKQLIVVAAEDEASAGSPPRENESTRDHSSHREREDSPAAASESGGEESIDPRIEEKLEELNRWTDRINNLEKEFDETNAIFRSFLTEYSDKLKNFAKKIGVKSVNEARIYYETKEKARVAQLNCQRTVVAYEKACRMLVQAKDEIDLTERKFHHHSRPLAASVESEHSSSTSTSPTRTVTASSTGSPSSGSPPHSPSTPPDFDVTWQEMLNQATIKLREAEILKNKNKEEHEQSMRTFIAIEEEVQRLEKKLKPVIRKTQPYFEESVKFKNHLINIKKEIELLNEKIMASKSYYAVTLKDLEGISEEIHERRHLRRRRLEQLQDILVHQSSTTDKTRRTSRDNPQITSIASNSSLAAAELMCEIPSSSSPSNADDAFSYQDIVPELDVNSPRFQIEVKPRTLAVLSPESLNESLMSADSAVESMTDGVDRLHFNEFEEVNLD